MGEIVSENEFKQLEIFLCFTLPHRLAGPRLLPLPGFSIFIFILCKSGKRPQHHAGVWACTREERPGGQLPRRTHMSLARRDGVPLQILGSVFVNFPLFVFSFFFLRKSRLISASEGEEARLLPSEQLNAIRMLILCRVLVER